MKTTKRTIRHNATFVEYAMLAGLVAVVVAVAVMAFGSKLTTLFSSTTEKVGQVETKVNKSDLSK